MSPALYAWFQAFTSAMILDRTADSESSCALTNKTVVQTTIIKQAPSLMVSSLHSMAMEYMVTVLFSCMEMSSAERQANAESAAKVQDFLGVLCDLGGKCSCAAYCTDALCLLKWSRMASAWVRVTTAESAAESACFTACTLPKCSSKRRVVLSPTPGISRSSVERSRIWRRLRWKVTANRWASSRISCTKCSTGE